MCTRPMLASARGAPAGLKSPPPPADWLSMRARLRELWLPAFVAGACSAGLMALGMLSPAFSDFELEAEPSLHALREGNIDGFLALAPVYGGSLILRAPFALLPNLWGGGDLALFRSMAAPCLLAAAVFAVFLWRRAQTLGQSAVTCWIALLLVAANPITLRGLEIGHPEELFGGVLCVAAALAASARRPLLAGVLLGLALANKQWAVLAVIPLLAILPDRRPRMLAAAGGTCLLVMLPLLVGGNAVEATKTVAQDGGLIFQPWQIWWFLGEHGATVKGIYGSYPDHRNLPTWLAGHERQLVAAIVLAATLLLLPRVRRRGWPDGLLLLAFAFQLRCLVDTWNISYYAVPVVIALVTWELHACRRAPVLSLAVTLCAWFTLVWLPPYALPDVQALAYLAWSVPLTGLLAARLIWGERLHLKPALDGWTSPTGIRS
jgi:Glycosyltransferase family 87